jgi:staphylococcal nuclease domain-containing protein 1
LIDPTDPNAADDPLACINADLVREGLATVDKGLKYVGSYPQVVGKLDAGVYFTWSLPGRPLTS